MIKTRVFDKLHGRDIIGATLQSSSASVSILNYGCVVRDWRVGNTSVVLGFDNIDNYVTYPLSFGAIAGRVANRTALGQFSLNGTDYQLPINDGVNHLHGGFTGLGRRVWALETDSDANAILLTYHSPDGEEGYPAAVDFSVRFQLHGVRLTCEMTGIPDAATPINLLQHSYYNLTGAGDVRDHIIQIAADNYTADDKTQITTGEIAPVRNTRFGFTEPTSFNLTDPERRGVGKNLILNPTRNVREPSAKAYSPLSNLQLKLWTEEPSLQLFNAPAMNIPVAGINGENYQAFSGVCLEAQHFPGSLSHAG